MAHASRAHGEREVAERDVLRFALAVGRRTGGHLRPPRLQGGAVHAHFDVRRLRPLVVLQTPRVDQVLLDASLRRFERVEFPEHGGEARRLLRRPLGDGHQVAAFLLRLRDGGLAFDLGLNELLDVHASLLKANT